MSAPASPAINGAKLHEFVMKAVGEMGAAMNAALIIVGDKLGLYKAMAGAGPLTPAELAAKTKTTERYVREWLSAQAAGGFVEYDAATGKFTLPNEQAMALADEQSPVFLPGFFQMLGACFVDEPKISEAFRTGKGFGWHEHDHALFTGCERFFRPNYRAHLITEWIPALGDTKSKLEQGAKVADIGCGLGTSTILMAQAFPKSTFVGFDYHPGSIELAKEAAAKAGLGDRVKFDVAPAKGFPGKGYQLVTFFDCLHDMGDPEGAARHVLGTLDPGGTWMIVEPYANDKLEDNLNPIGRVYYGASTMLCTPASLSQEVGLGLGAQAGEGRLTKILNSAGFTRVRRAAETPFNIVLEARA
jgi:SAM-dependent methyltransferase